MIADRSPLRPAAGKALLWIVLLIALLGAGLAYHFNSGALRISVSRDQILERLNQKLPLEKTYLYVFKVTFDSPRVELVEASERINAGLDIALEFTLLNDPDPLRGHTDASAGVRYVAHEGAFYLQDANVEALVLEGLPEQFTERVHSVLAQGLQSYFDSQPIYRLTERQSHQAAKAVLQDISISSEGIVLHLGPANDNAGSVSAHSG